MSSKRARAFILATGSLLLASCNTMNTHIGDEDPAFGESEKYDQAIQTVNPLPVYPPSAAQPGANGVKAEAAVKRYRTDTVKQVESSQTTAGSSSAGMSASPSH